jgi:hypothetical protein
MTASIALSALALAAGLRAAPAAVAVSTDTARPLTAADLYRGAQFRDPFLPPSAGSSQAAPAARPAPSGEEVEFSIHELVLKGILQDSGGATAILVDNRLGTGYILKGGRLYDYKKKPVSGVSGEVRAAKKMVVLNTADKDRQELTLGEEDEAR